MEIYRPGLSVSGINTIPIDQVASVTLANPTGTFIVKPLTVTSGYNFVEATKSDSRFVANIDGTFEVVLWTGEENQLPAEVGIAFTDNAFNVVWADNVQSVVFKTQIGNLNALKLIWDNSYGTFSIGALFLHTLIDGVSTVQEIVIPDSPLYPKPGTVYGGLVYLIPPNYQKGDKGETGATGPQGIQGVTGATGAQGIQGVTGATGPQGATGTGGALGYWGSFWDTTDQSATAANTAYPILLNNADINNNGITLDPVHTSRVTFGHTGVYSLTFSIQFVNTDSQIHDVNVWLRKNDSGSSGDVPDSDTKISIPNKHGNNDGYGLMTVNFVQHINANDYIELIWATNNIQTSIQSVTAGTNPVSPSIPGVVFTATQVMYTQIGPTGPTGPSSGITYKSGVPASKTSTGTLGEIAIDNSGSTLYICTATNTWQKVSLNAASFSNPGGFA